MAIARAAADRFGLERVLFAPVGRQPLKQGTGAASFRERMAMTEFACAEDARFVASEIDGPRENGGPNYTVDTLARLGELMPGARIFNLVGADSFRDLGRWRDPERLLALAEWIVVSRPGFALPGHGAGPNELALSEEQRSRIHLLGTVHEGVSATKLRECLQRPHTSPARCAKLLPPGVLAYIAQHGLYLGPGSGAEGTQPLP